MFSITTKGATEMKTNRRTSTAILSLMLVGAMIFCLLFVAGCKSKVPDKGGINEPSAENTGSPSQNQNSLDEPDDTKNNADDTNGSDSHHEDDDHENSHHENSHHDNSNDDNSGSAASGNTANFIKGMGCDDVTCTKAKHHHDCPADCADYDHYHHCELDCIVESHHHNRDILPVESDKVS